MKAIKGSRKIVLNDIEYRWRANGNDGYISIVIWPREQPGATILGILDYDESFTKGDSYFGCWISDKNQIVVTNRFIRLILEYACEHRGYSHSKSGTQLTLGALEKIIDYSNAVRANEDDASRRDLLLGRKKG